MRLGNWKTVSVHVMQLAKENEMKIVRVDNFNRDHMPDLGINLGCMDSDAANAIAKVLNEHLSGVEHPYYYRVMADSYKLNEGDPNE